MTVEQKAKDIMGKVRPYCSVVNRGKTIRITGKTENAKVVAIVLCDEVLDLLNGWPTPRDRNIESEIKYYGKVKEYINKNYL